MVRNILACALALSMIGCAHTADTTAGSDLPAFPPIEFQPLD